MVLVLQWLRFSCRLWLLTVVDLSECANQELIANCNSDSACVCVVQMREIVLLAVRDLSAMCGVGVPHTILAKYYSALFRCALEHIM